MTHSPHDSFAVRLIHTRPEDEERFARIARERRWRIVTPADTALPDVVVTRDLNAVYPPHQQKRKLALDDTLYPFAGDDSPSAPSGDSTPPESADAATPATGSDTAANTARKREAPSAATTADKPAATTAANSAATTAAGPEENSRLAGPGIAVVRLIRPSDTPVSLPDRIIHDLPETSDDAALIAVVEAAARNGRLLSRLHDRAEHLRQISTTDGLTGLHNRMHLLRVLDREIRRVQRAAGPLSAIMIDLDHFKNINDTYGHTFGDQVLAAFARLLQETTRSTDTVGRYGGEEFLVVLPATDLEGACAVAEKIRRAVEQRTFSEGFFTIDITASLGVASTCADITTAETLVQWADRALYRAKQTGRNRVCVADAEQASPFAISSGESIRPSAPTLPTILLAHPDPDALPGFAALKSADSLRFQIAANSDEALRFLAREVPSILFVSSALRPAGGWELLQRIQDRASDRFFPIVILEPTDGPLPPAGPRDAHAPPAAGSGIAASAGPVPPQHHRPMLSQGGPDDILPEDVTPDVLQRRVQSLLRLKQLHDRFYETYDRLTDARARLVKAERLSALGQMASGVAHDFNNILSAILGRTDHLERFLGADSPAAADVKVIQKAARDGARTIRRIHAFSRSISDADSSEVPLVDVIDDCVQLTRVRWKDEAEKHGVKIEIETAVDPSLKTPANPTELREVFLNLFINALDAMPKGGRLTVRSVERPGSDQFLIEVTDTGIGIPPTVARRVFDPFFTTKKERGTGMGLSIVYGIMTRLEGDIEVKSQPGQGTTFRLWFARPKSAGGAQKTETAGGAERAADPSATATRAAKAAKSSMAPAEVAVRATGPKLRILVVEDEARVRDLFMDVLSEEGHRVEPAESSQQALELLAKTTFDCVITDLGLPDLPGWDVAKRAKERRPETAVILTSGWGEDYSADYLAGRGVDHWLPKPVSLDQLFSLLRTLPALVADGAA